MKSDDTFVYLIGGALVVIVGLILYSKYKEDQNPQASMIPWKPPTVQMIPTAVSSTKYYSAPINIPYQTQMDSPIVQNEENVKWTDWLGRERIITISRKVH